MAKRMRDAAALVAAARLETARASSEGLKPILDTLDPDDRRRLALLARDLHARLRPVDAVERAQVDHLVLCQWRRLMLDRVELRLLQGLAAGRPVDGLPSLGVLGRARARVDRDEAAAMEARAALARIEPLIEPHHTAARIAWLAERAAAQEALAAAVCGRPIPTVPVEAERAAQRAAHAAPEPAAQRAAHTAPEPARAAAAAIG